MPADSDALVVPSNLNTDVGFIGGGGLIYGINKNIAAELDITHSEFDADLTASERVILPPPTFRWARNTVSSTRPAETSPRSGRRTGHTAQ